MTELFFSHSKYKRVAVSLLPGLTNHMPLCIAFGLLYITVKSIYYHYGHGVSSQMPAKK